MQAEQTPANPQQVNADSEPIPFYDRAVLWMFLVGFLLFGIILLGDLICGFFR